jgi:hypothetical protein
MNEPTKKSPALALILGFAPAALSLAILTISGQNGPPRTLLWPMCAVSAVCCFASSFMLFRFKTGLAIAGGLLFLLLNGVISLFSGCVAVLNGMKF